MDYADDCFDAWGCVPADELLASCPGGGEALAAVAEELLRDERELTEQRMHLLLVLEISRQ